MKAFLRPVISSGYLHAVLPCTMSCAVISQEHENRASQSRLLCIRVADVFGDTFLVKAAR
jgi:hypothetical protein